MEYAWWWGVALVAVIIEMFTLDLTFLILGIAAASAGAVALIGLPFYVSVLVFAVIAILGIFVIRPIARKHMRLTALTKTGVDMIPGQTARVISTVDMDGGLIKIGGEEWTARLDKDVSVVPVEEGSRVYVVRVEGATAIVHAVD